MRSIAFLAGLLLAFSLVAVAAPAEARTLACTDLKGNGSCPGVVCADTDLDGTIEGYDDTCVIIYCLHGCCYGAACPPPDWE